MCKKQPKYLKLYFHTKCQYKVMVTLEYKVIYDRRFFKRLTIEVYNLECKKLKNVEQKIAPHKRNRKKFDGSTILTSTYCNWLVKASYVSASSCLVHHVDHPLSKSRDWVQSGNPFCFLPTLRFWDKREQPFGETHRKAKYHCKASLRFDWSEFSRWFFTYKQ